MKVLAFFSLLLAVTTSYPVVKTWTLSALYDAIENSKADPELMPYLMEAMNEFMNAMFTGKSEKVLHGIVPSPSGNATWTVEELTQGIANPEMKPEFKAAMTQAKNFIDRKNTTGNKQETAEVAVPALDISTWTLLGLEEALKNPNTKKDLIPYLEKARVELRLALDKGEIREKHIVTPIGLIAPEGDYEFVLKPSKHLS